MHKHTKARLNNIKRQVDVYLDEESGVNIYATLRNISDLVERIKVYEEVHRNNEIIQGRIDNLEEAWTRDLPLSGETRIAVQNIFGALKGITDE